MNVRTHYKLFIASLLIVFTSSASFAQSATVTVHQDKKITQLLDLKKDMEKANELSDGFTIQLYYGELIQANEILRQYRGSYGNWSASIKYETPNFKVWAGNFSTRIEADRALLEIQKSFPAAFILKPERRK